MVAKCSRYKQSQRSKNYLQIKFYNSSTYPSAETPQIKKHYPSFPNLLHNCHLSRKSSGARRQRIFPREMDSFEKGFPSPKNSPDLSSSGESNENDVSHNNQLDSDSTSQNPNKSVMKHFMSPTVSAKSKVTVPRKKILAEKNESFTSPENAHVAKFPNLRNGPQHSGTSRCHEILTPAFSTCCCTTKSDDEDMSNFSADSSLKPYDPLTNYLSPRPKYLRYKPNRRNEILFTRDFGVKEDNSFLQRSEILNSLNQKFVDEEKISEFEHEPLTSFPQEGSSEFPITKEEKENDCDSEDTDDEEEEDEELLEKGWSLKGMVKFLLLLVVIAVSTSCISTMNGPTPSPVVEGMGFLRDGFYRMHRRLFEAVSTNVQSVAWVNGSGMQIEDAQTGFLEVNKPFVNEIVQMIEQCDGLIGDICDQDEIEEDLNWSDWETAEYEDTDGSSKEGSDQLPRWESTEPDVATDKELKNVEDDIEGLHQRAALDDTQRASGIEHDNQISEGNQLENDHNTNENEGSFGAKRSEEIARIGERAADTTRCMEDEICHEADEVEGSSAWKSGQNMLETEWQTSETTASRAEDTVFVPAVTDSNNNEFDASGLDIEVKSMKVVKFLDLGSIAAIWFSFISIVLAASLVYIYSTRPIQAPLPDTFHEVSDRKEKLISVRPSVEFENRQEKAESVVKPLSACYSFEENTEEYTHIQAPDVELLGEFVIGEYSSSLRSCGRKGRIIETEESINPISHAAHVESRTPPVAQVRLLNKSNTDSSSYGSFAAGKIILRKEGGRDGDAKLVTTPLRRSSRIRNLSVTSP